MSFIRYIVLLIAVFISAPGKAFAPDLKLLDVSELHKNPSPWIILDARPRAKWQKGHIPGALSFSWEDYTRRDEKGVPYRMLPPEEMAAALGNLGISENSAILVYGDADSSWGGEGWVCWILAYLGHKGPVRLLDGGFFRWRKEKFPVSKDAENASIKAANYLINIQRGVYAATDELERYSSSMVLVDVRSTLEWMSGRIPGAIHIPWNKFLQGPEGRPLSADALRNLLEENGISPEQPQVYYCSGGVRSAYTWMVNELAGISGVRNYEGGMKAWKMRSQGISK